MIHGTRVATRLSKGYRVPAFMSCIFEQKRYRYMAARDDGAWDERSCDEAYGGVSWFVS